MNRIFAISDIHGYGHLLPRLLAAADYRPRMDRLFLLGDYVNKGPDSTGTLELVNQLCSTGAVALQGNNERKWLLGIPESITVDSMAAARYRSIITSMPLWAEYNRYIFVHAGLRPDVPLDRQSAEDLTEIRLPFHESLPLPGKTIVFGHTSTFRFGVKPDTLWTAPGKIGIDTGAGHGHYLSLVELTAGWQWSIPVLYPGTVQRTRIAALLSH